MELPMEIDRVVFGKALLSVQLQGLFWLQLVYAATEQDEQGVALVAFVDQHRAFAVAPGLATPNQLKQRIRHRRACSRWNGGRRDRSRVG